MELCGQLVLWNDTYLLFLSFDGYGLRKYEGSLWSADKYGLRYQFASPMVWRLWFTKYIGVNSLVWEMRYQFASLIVCWLWSSNQLGVCEMR